MQNLKINHQILPNPKKNAASKSAVEPMQNPGFVIEKNFFTLLLSYCPGGIYEVAVIAIFFDLDPEFVSFHHIIRLLMILFIVPVILRFLKKT